MSFCRLKIRYDQREEQEDQEKQEEYTADEIMYKCPNSKYNKNRAQDCEHVDKR